MGAPILFKIDLTIESRIGDVDEEAPLHDPVLVAKDAELFQGLTKSRSVLLIDLVLVVVVVTTISMNPT